MHLTQAQFKRFTRLLYSLLSFANEKHNVLGEPFTPWEDYGADQIADLSQFVFEDHREVIGQYLAENPDELADSALEQIAQWDKAAFADAFFVIEVSKDYTTLIGDELLFNVVGLDCEAAVDLGQPGDAVFTVLLPFEDRIVYGMITTPIPDSFDDIRDQVASDALAMLAEGFVASTAADLLQVGPGCVARSVERRRIERDVFGGGFDSLDSFLGSSLGGANTRSADGNTGTPGTHVGALAGMPEDERDAAILDHVHRQLPQFDEFLGKFGPRAFMPHAPVRTVGEALALLTKQELYNMTQDFGIVGCSKMKKAELASTIESELITAANAPMIIASLLGDERTLSLADRALAANGAVEISSAEHAALPEEEKWCPYPPFMNVFEHGGSVTCVIPNEVISILHEAECGELISKFRQIRHARRLVETYMEMCGIISIDELTNIYLRYYPGELNRREFGQLIYDYGLGGEEGYDIWTYHGEPHLLHYNLVEPSEVKGASGPADVDGDAFGNKPSKMESWRREIRSRHDEIETWEIAGKNTDAFEAFNWLNHVRSLPSHRALQAFLDAHIPNGKDDYFFADKVLEDMYSIINYGGGPEVLIDHLNKQGVVLSNAAESGQLLVLLSLFINDMPRWENNGWSAKELEGMREQKAATK